MENAQLINLSRQTALRNQLNVVANNMANINTAGYKSQRLLFEEIVMPVAEATEFETADHHLHYVHDYATSYNFLPGSIRQSGKELDVAVDGEGWFSVQTEDGVAYTRHGAFHLDNTGMLVTAMGKPVLTDGGPVTFTPEDGAIEIARDGTISTEAGVRGRLQLVTFDVSQDLLQIGENLYTHEEAVPYLEGRVVQGALENSNVQGVVEVTRLIEITRAYQTVSKLMEDTNKLRENAIATLGKLSA